MGRLNRVIAILFAICLATSSIAVCAAQAEDEAPAETAIEATATTTAETGAAATGATSADATATADPAPDAATPAATSGDQSAAIIDEAATPLAAASTATSGSDSYGSDIDPVTVYLRVAVDGVWKYVGRDGNIYDSNTAEGFEAITVTKQANRAGGDRAIIPASVLEAPLSKFGFSTDELYRADKDYSGGSVDWGNFIFGYCDSGTGQIYADVSPQLVTVDGESSWYIFTKGRQWIHMDTGDKSLDLYYLPANRNDGAFTRPQSFFCETNRATTDAQIIADNSFYPVSVSDPDQRVYDGSDTLPTGYLMATAGTAKASFTVKKPGEYAKWQVADADGNTVAPASVTDNGDGTLTYTFSEVTSALTFTAVEHNPNKFELVYTAAMADADKETLGNIGSGDQVICENTTIGEEQQATQTVAVDASTDGETYTFLSPNSDIATVYWTQSTTRKFIYTFVGWKIEGQDKVYAAGDTISMAELKSLASTTGTLGIKSVWSGNDTNTSSPHMRSVNFYLNLACEILDVDGSTGAQAASNFTQSLYSTRVSGTDTFGSGGFSLIASESTDSAYTVDAKIRNMASVGIKPPSSWTNYTQDGVTLERFPTDEEIMAQVRALGSQISIDGEVIPRESITSANFTVRWYVVKYDTTDGWHIDGVLVAKKARLVVTKTFEGETEAKEAFTQAHGYSTLDDFDASDGKSFHIDVTHEATVDGSTTDVTDYQLLILPESDVSQARTGTNDRRYGYTSYDPDTNTYTWEIETRQSRLYTVSEKNYYLSADDGDDDLWNNLTWYEVHNSSSAYNTSGWTEYDAQTGAQVKVHATAYPTDVPSSAWQTVGFRNAYVHKGTLAVYKNDLTTGAAMPGVAFTVEQTGTGGSSVLYQRNGTNEYTTDSSVYTANPDEYTKIDGSKAVTDSNGVFYLSLAAPDESSDVEATYELTEDKSTAEGYEGPDTITFKMSYNNGIAEGDLSWTPADADLTWAKVGTNQFILNIYNRSAAYTSVTAKKQWAAGTVDKKPVTVQLWRKYGDVEEAVPDKGVAGASALTDIDGNEAANEVQLSASNNWAFSWGNLPLFINNQQVTYFLRETWIGDPTSSDSVAYDTSADSEDGYADYAVTTEDARYAAGEKPDTTADDPREGFAHDAPKWSDGDATVYADHVLLMINNAEVKGVISFTKKDREGLAGKPLAGATFTLYSDADCTNVLQEVTTGTDGVVTFSHRPAGTYYIKETEAPAGYSFEDSTVYKAVVSNGRPTITRVGDATQASITNITNKFGAGLNVRKIADGDIATAASVSGAEFTLSKQNGTDEWAKPKTLTTNANGGLTFTGLDQGTYTLTESKSPAGYESTQGISLTFTVDTDEETGVTSFTLADKSVIQPSAESGFVAWADASTASNIAYTVTVRNVPLQSLPAAGGKGIYLQTAAGVALMCAACAAWFVHRSGWHTGGGRRA